MHARTESKPTARKEPSRHNQQEPTRPSHKQASKHLHTERRTLRRTGRSTSPQQRHQQTRVTQHKHARVHSTYQRFQAQVVGEQQTHSTTTVLARMSVTVCVRTLVSLRTRVFAGVLLCALTWQRGMLTSSREHTSGHAWMCAVRARACFHYPPLRGKRLTQRPEQTSVHGVITRRETRNPPQRAPSRS